MSSGNVHWDGFLLTRNHVVRLQEVEEALDIEAKRLGLADGGALLESLRTRRMLETADLELKVTTTKDLRGSSGPILTINAIFSHHSVKQPSEWTLR